MYICIVKLRIKAMNEVKNRYINVNGKLMDLGYPRVMGILNVTPDSFYAGSRKQTENEILQRVRQIIDEGGDIIDLGAYSSRPGADHISVEEESDRLRRALTVINREFPDVVLSVDTFRSEVARMCVEEYGVSIINDISSGSMDSDMLATVAGLGVPYIMMHMQGTPQNMQMNPKYDNVLKEVLYYFSEKVRKMRDLGAKDIIIDPGFGFGKTLEHNYELMNHMDELGIFGLPVLVGISRKSMIYRLLDTTPDESLNGTTALNMAALMKGADILRVHDVKEAVETARIYAAMRGIKKPE